MNTAPRVAQGSQLLETPCVRVEWAEAGPVDGPPLLVIHGSGSGFDQGLLFGADPAARGRRVIAPSCFGCLRTPFPADPPAERQADQFAGLLDALDGGHPLLGHQARIGAEIDAFFGAALRR